MVAGAACAREGEGARQSSDPRCAAPVVARREGIGPFAFGDSLDTSAGAPCVAGDTSISFAGLPIRARIVRAGGATFALVVTAGRLTHAFVRDSGVATDRGIRVGSSMADVRRAYGRICALHGGLRVVANAAAAPEIRFVVDGRGWRPPGAVLSVDTLGALVPDEARVALWMTHDFARIGESLCDRPQGVVDSLRPPARR